MATRSSYGNTTLSNIPIPDPSVITEREISKAKEELRNEFRAALRGAQDEVNARRDGYIRLFDARLEGLAQRFDEKVHSAIIRIDSLDQRLVERDRRFDGAIVAHKDAATAQIAATTAALAKSEAAATKELDGIKSLINAKVEGLSADLSNLKGRLDRGEGGYQGARLQVQDQREDATLHTAIVSGIVGFLVLLVAIIALWISTARPVRGDGPGAFAVAPLNPSATAPRVDR